MEMGTIIQGCVLFIVKSLVITWKSFSYYAIFYVTQIQLIRAAWSLAFRQETRLKIFKTYATVCCLFCKKINNDFSLVLSHIQLVLILCVYLSFCHYPKIEWKYLLVLKHILRILHWSCHQRQNLSSCALFFLSKLHIFPQMAVIK